jgi:hypothetical protein
MSGGRSGVSPYGQLEATDGALAVSIMNELDNTTGRAA